MDGGFSAVADPARISHQPPAAAAEPGEKCELGSGLPPVGDVAVYPVGASEGEDGGEHDHVEEKIGQGHDVLLCRVKGCGAGGATARGAPVAWKGANCCIQYTVKRPWNPRRFSLAGRGRGIAVAATGGKNRSGRGSPSASSGRTDADASLPRGAEAVNRRPYERVSTSPLTAATDLSIIACSSALSENSMILSTPSAPSTVGTPTK